LLALLSRRWIFGSGGGIFFRCFFFGVVIEKRNGSCKHFPRDKNPTDRTRKTVAGH
jgi:hypothetical protein